MRLLNIVQAEFRASAPHNPVSEDQQAEHPVVLLEQMQDDVLERLDALNQQVLSLLDEAIQARGAQAD